jgi:hypothetical protein
MEEEIFVDVLANGLTKEKKRIGQPAAMAPYVSEYTTRVANERASTPQRMNVISDVSPVIPKARSQGFNRSDSKPTIILPVRDAPG